MTGTFFKATRPDGLSFHSAASGERVDYALALATGEAAIPPDSVAAPELCGPGVLHAATVPTETLVGGSWPCRLFKVEGVPLDLDYSEHPYKRGFASLRVVEELPAWLALGPQGAHVAALVDRAGRLTNDEARNLDAAWYAARDATGYTAWYAARAAARDAAQALVVRDLIGQCGFTQEHYDRLTRAWREVVGKVHPDDKDGAYDDESEERSCTTPNATPAKTCATPPPSREETTVGEDIEVTVVVRSRGDLEAAAIRKASSWYDATETGHYGGIGGQPQRQLVVKKVGAPSPHMAMADRVQTWEVSVLVGPDPDIARADSEQEDHRG